MKHIKLYEAFGMQRHVISFDFDGTLHSEPDPICMDLECLHPITAVIKRLMEESRTNDIVIVSKNPETNKRFIEDFVDAYDLPVMEIYCTNRMPKKSTLITIGAIRHYDDKDMVDELAGTGIEFVRVYPGTEEIDERKEEKIWLEISQEEIQHYDTVMSKAPAKYKHAMSVLDTVKTQDGKISWRQKRELDAAMKAYPDPRRWGPIGD